MSDANGSDLARLAAREPAPPKAKRFYANVGVAGAAGGFRVLLDARPVRTPGRQILETRSSALAEAIAAEWRGQGAELDPASMPLTRLTATALDRVAAEREAMTSALLAYIATDLLCYRAPHPADLAARQAAVWQPVLDWLEAALGIALPVVSGILPAAPSPAAEAATRRVIAGLSIEEFTALQAAVAATGSLALGLALVHGRIAAAEAIAAADLDETYQNERWGEDAEALARRTRIAAEVEAAERYLRLVRG